MTPGSKTLAPRHEADPAELKSKRTHRAERSSTSISSAILRRYSALLPRAMACSMQCRRVVAQYLLLDAAQRRPHGQHLRDHVDAIAVVPASRARGSGRAR
jgi:hypothetical protein